MSQNNPFADAWKSFSEQVPAVDFSEAIAASRKNIEAFTAASQIVAENVQEIAKLQAKIGQQNAEKAAELFKNVASSKDAQASAAKQAEFAKDAFEKSLSDSREIFELASKANSKAFELVGKQVTDNISKFSKPSKKQAA